MRKYDDFRDLEVWQRCSAIRKRIWELCRIFPAVEKYRLAEQMIRASRSATACIAEGAARSSNREFAQFLYIALGSLSEVETQWLLALELGIAPNGPEKHIDPVRRMLLGLIRHTKNRT